MGRRCWKLLCHHGGSHRKGRLLGEKPRGVPQGWSSSLPFLVLSIPRLWGQRLLPSKSLSTEGAPPPLLVFFMFTQNLLGRRKKKPPPEKQTLLSAFSLKQSFIHLLAGSPEWNLPLTCSKVTLQHPVLNNQILLNVTLQQKRALSLGMPRWH